MKQIDIKNTTKDNFASKNAVLLSLIDAAIEDAAKEGVFRATVDFDPTGIDTRDLIRFLNEEGFAAQSVKGPGDNDWDKPMAYVEVSW